MGRDEQREQTRRKLYDAALTIFRRDGVAACRIDDITRLAGVSRATFYFHFPTKDDVLLERMRETEGPITAALDALPQDAPLHAVLDALCQAMAEIWEPDPALLPDIAAVGLRLAANALSDSGSDHVRTVLARRFRSAARRNELSQALPAETLSDLYLGHILAGLVAWYGTGRDRAPLRAVLLGVTALFFHGAGPE